MKKLIFLTTACIFAFNTSLKSLDDNNKKYCCKKKDGKVTVMHDGSALKSDATLDNGTTIKTDGTVIKKDGSKVMLKEGECVNMDGKIVMEKHKNKGMDKEMDRDNNNSK
jgi:hypothetical protein